MLALIAVPLWAQGGAPLKSLKSIAVPKPPDLDRYVRDEKTLVVLGKALFWDMQLSSDSRVACATCHFHAGADHRRQNQLSTTKDPVALNWDLAPGDFPFGPNFMAAGHRAGSAGVYPREFLAVSHDGAPDSGSEPEGMHLRQVTRRNAPSVINSVYTFRNFWDGRAGNIFTAQALADAAGKLTPVDLRIENSSLASQALGPPMDAGEMSYRGRTWPMLGRKMLDARPLALQRVAADDSVLGPYASRTGPGLAAEHTYVTLIRAAFRDEYWKAGSHQAEHNFAMFFGLAIQAYESTLISDESPYDRFLDGQRTALTPLEQTGLAMFQRRACASCHVDPELTLATHSGVIGYGPFKAIGPDAGFFHTGVEPVANDTDMGGGSFKTPSLRNIEFTGPYFHTGSKSTLEQIVDFYTFGGDYGSPNLRRWGPDPTERLAMPALMKTFTDDRVRFERAPFDHPELCVPVGHDEADKGRDRWASIPLVGAKGNSAPLQTFEELLLGIGKDGSRAHSLTEACSIK